MNKFLKYTSIALLFGIVAFSGISLKGSKIIGAKENNLTKVADIKIGEKYSNTELENLKKFTYVLDAKDDKDVNGDKINDTVLVLGTKVEKDFMFMDKLNILVQDGKTKKYSMQSLNNGGYGAKLFIGDFNKDKINDMMVTSSNGGNGGTISLKIVSFTNNKFTDVLNKKVSEGLSFEGNFVNGFKAEAICKEINKKFTIDLSSSKDEYIKQKVYDKNGKLLEKVSIWSDGLVDIKPIDWNLDGNYELLCEQKIFGYCHADRISDIQFLVGCDKSNWNIKNLNFTTYLVRK